MFQDPREGRPDAWQEQRMIMLRQMASALRSRAARRPPGPAKRLRQTARELERSANRLQALISRPF